jgi:hypothetical protein
MNPAYTLEVTYQILDSSGKPMSGYSLSGISISERFNSITGNANFPAPSTWTLYSRNGISSNGTFTDYLSAGGLGSFSNAANAFQSFAATGFLSNGLPLMYQQLMVSGFGATTPVLDNAYGPNNVSINGLGLGRDPTTQCH